MKGRADYSKAQLSRYKHSFCKDKSYKWHSSRRISNSSNSALALVRQVIPIGNLSSKMELAGYFMEMRANFLSKEKAKALLTPASSGNRISFAFSQTSRALT